MTGTHAVRATGGYRAGMPAAALRLVRYRPTTAPADTPASVGLLDDAGGVVPLGPPGGGLALSDLLHADDPPAAVAALPRGEALAADAVRLLSPLDRQEVWAAGVTYKRSQVARMSESESAADHYDRVYTAERPELFFKSLPARVVPDGEPIRVRSDSRWTVPEPELTLLVSPAGRIVGYAVGDDVSARDIEGENPLYLPQAKTYDGSCAIGPAVLLADGPLDRAATVISLTIERGGEAAFEDHIELSQMKRSLEELVGWLTREYALPDGAALMTGTGIVPPDQFTLEDGDVVTIAVSGVGSLRNPVVRG